MEQLIPISEAARAVGLGRDAARRLAIRHRIAVRRGGSEDRPWLVVAVSDLQRAYRSETYVPRGASSRPARRRSCVSMEPLDPAVRC